MAGSVSITLDKERHLRVDINAITDALEVSEKAVSDFVTNRSVTLPAVRALLWAGSKWEDRRLTLQQVGDLMQAEFLKSGTIDLIEMASKIWDAMEASGLISRGEEKNGKAEAGKPSTSASG